MALNNEDHKTEGAVEMRLRRAGGHSEKAALLEELGEIGNAGAPCQFSIPGPQTKFSATTTMNYLGKDPTGSKYFGQKETGER
jgi:hypothetical protein